MDLTSDIEANKLFVITDYDKISAEYRTVLDEACYGIFYYWDSAKNICFPIKFKREKYHKESMIYFILKNYIPNTAPTNRILSYLETFENEGVAVTVYYLLPGKQMEVINRKYKNIKIEYCWRYYTHKNKLSKLLIFFISLYKIRRIFKSGDIVYTYGVNAIMKHLLGQDGVRYFAERTEHPDVTAKESWPFYITKESSIAIYKKLDGLFVISTSLKEYFVSIGVKSEKVHIINMTVDVKRFANVKKQVVEERYIAYCGTASNNKDGVDELIKAFGIVAGVIEDVKLYIIGKTPSKNDQSNNIALIDQLKLKDRIVFTGVVTAHKMPQLLKNSEVLALDRPDSLQAKCGFPTKLGEYLLTKNPVVVTKVGDIPRFLKDGVSALLSEQCNPDDFSSKLIWALTHPKDAAIIGENGAKVALREFNSEIETKKIISIFYSSIVC